MEFSNANTEKPTSFASPANPPESLKDDTLAAKDTSKLASAIQCYRTHIRLHVQQTGTETVFGGATCEIRGHIDANGERKAVNVNLHKNRNFASEHGGLGRMVCELTKTTALLPTNFKGVLFEEGGGGVINRYFADTGVDWNTASDDLMNGPHSRAQRNRDDYNWKGHLWWQVTAL